MSAIDPGSNETAASVAPAPAAVAAEGVPATVAPPDRLALRYGAAALSGALVFLASPPQGQAWTQWFNFVPLLLALTGHRRTDARLGYVAGVALVFANFSWLAKTITLFSNLGWTLAILVVLLFSAVFGLPYALLGALARPLRKRFGPLWVLLFAALWTGVEFLTPAVFPYAIGAPQYRTPWVCSW